MKKLLLVFFGVFVAIVSHSSVWGDTNQDLFGNKNILILGGTGFIGRALTTELLKYDPANIFILSRDEVKHFNMSKLFDNNPKIHHIIGDIRDYQCLLDATKGKDIVFHAAALKRIDILESNVEECIKTNILGSMNVFNSCVSNGVGKVIFISTDKASMPINTYGACKFISEKIFTNYDQAQIPTKFTAVRYGNVLESTGSVIPIFLDKIKRGEDIPLTDPGMTRFIIDKQEAIQLIFDAVRYGDGGDVFVKHLPSMKITDLIEVLKDSCNAENNVKNTGLRPGEKIHEVLINHSEIPRTYAFKDFFVIQSTTFNMDHSTQTALPIYIQEGKQMNTSIMKEFSSDQVVISKSDLSTLFLTKGLL